MKQRRWYFLIETCYIKIHTFHMLGQHIGINLGTLDPPSGRSPSLLRLIIREERVNKVIDSGMLNEKSIMTIGRIHQV